MSFLTDFELHREGLGLLPARGLPDDPSAIRVRMPDNEIPLESCTCSKGKTRKGATCEHLKALRDGQRQLQQRHPEGWQSHFEGTIWFRLAKAIYASSQLACDQVRVRQVERVDTGQAAIRITDQDGNEVAQYLDTSPARIALLERTGKAPKEGAYVDRAAMLKRLGLFQLSQSERAFEKMGMKSGRQSWEESFWHRLAYHCVREFGVREPGVRELGVRELGVREPGVREPGVRELGVREGGVREAGGREAAAREPSESGTFHPAIDKKTGDFTLTHRDPEGVDIVKITLPRKRVPAVLSLLRKAYPEQADLQIHPVPLRSLFKVTRETELDLRVRPVIKLLQESGEERFFDGSEMAKFRYGNLVFVKELGVLAELPKDRRNQNFQAPKSMKLQRSQVAAFLDDHVDALADGSLVLDEPLQGLRVWKTYDRLALGGEALDPGSSRLGPGAYRLSVQYGFGDQTVSLAELLRARREKLPYLETATGWVDLQAPAFAELERLDQRLGEDGEVHVSAGELLRFQALAEQPLEGISNLDRGSVLRRLLDQRPPEPYRPPEGFRSELRDYQRIGVDWLRFLAEQRLGGLLCDDMGLGKTHQSMALMACLSASPEPEADPELGKAPFLVVCPTSVMSHWRDKIRSFAPKLRPRVYHGPDRYLDRDLDSRHVVITSYGVLRNDIERLVERPFRAAIFDEVQYLKNRGTVSYEAAARLPTVPKIGLTGTPIENSLQELKALFDLVLPGYLGTDVDFHERYDRALVRTGVGMKENRARLDQLRRLISPFVLRRLKTSVLDELPEKIEDVRTCELTPEQVALYRQVVDTRARPLVQKIRADDGKPLPYLHVFAVLNLLKQICDHPALVSGEVEKAEKHRSGKWELYTEILRECFDSGQKVVVFSQYLGMLEIMARHLEKEGVEYARLQGSTPADERGRLVDRFNTKDDCRVFLASLKAGGTGIDLVGGSVVIHYDRWWNAAREDQATDRVHRLGQKRAVQVFKLVTEGTLEERIAHLIETKRGMLDAVVQEDDAKLSKLFDRGELLELLKSI